jgi:hypothetical protein
MGIKIPDFGGSFMKRNEEQDHTELKIM